MSMYNVRENSTNVYIFTLVFLGLPTFFFFTCFTKCVILVMTIMTIKIVHVKSYMLKK